MELGDIQAVIDSAKARGHEPLDRFIRGRLAQPMEGEVEEARDVCIEIIDAIPIFLARAKQEADARSLQHVVDPLLEHIARYFISPIDLIPEMTHGLAGLLDDTYLVLRILKNLDGGPEPFLDWELEEPILFLQGLVGSQISERLDALALEARQDAESKLFDLWEAMGAEA